MPFYIIGMLCVHLAGPSDLQLSVGPVLANSSMWSLRASAGLREDRKIQGRELPLLAAVLIEAWALTALLVTLA